MSGSISIHALREEGDAVQLTPHLHTINFYPRPPRGGRPPTVSLDHRLEAISIHALREEGDAFLLASRRRPLAFLSTPSARRATFGLRCADWYG